MLTFYINFMSVLCYKNITYNTVNLIKFLTCSKDFIKQSKIFVVFYPNNIFDDIINYDSFDLDFVHLIL